jgi:hypothetical protein
MCRNSAIKFNWTAAAKRVSGALAVKVAVKVNIYFEQTAPPA